MYLYTILALLIATWVAIAVYYYYPQYFPFQGPSMSEMIPAPGLPLENNTLGPEDQTVSPEQTESPDTLQIKTLNGLRFNSRILETIEHRLDGSGFRNMALVQAGLIQLRSDPVSNGFHTIVSHVKGIKLQSILLLMKQFLVNG